MGEVELLSTLCHAVLGRGGVLEASKCLRQCRRLAKMLVASYDAAENQAALGELMLHCYVCYTRAGSNPSSNPPKTPCSKFQLSGVHSVVLGPDDWS